MTRYLASGVLLYAVIACPLVFGNEKAVRQCVVRVTADVSPPDPLNPWRKLGTARNVGSGVIISGRRVLTAAHVVMHAVRVEVQPPQSGKSYRAIPLITAPEVDLALLQLDSQETFAAGEGVTISPRLPQPQDQLLVHGFAYPGELLKSSTMVCGRSEYGFSRPFIGSLMVEVDGSLGPGYSGGPCTLNDQLVGILSLQAAGQATGFMIPSVEILMFLADAADGRYEGKPTIPCIVRPLSNVALRRRLKLPDELTGVLVLRTLHMSESVNGLAPEDVLVKIGKLQIDNEGNVNIERAKLFVHHNFLVSRVARNGKVTVTIFRGGRLQTLEAATVPSSEADMLMCPYLANGTPSYYVWGPIVFSTVYQETAGMLFAQSAATEGALVVLHQLSASGNPVLHTLALRDAPDQRVVFVVDSISHDTLVGYDNPLYEVVRKVNGVEVRNLRHLALFAAAGKGSEGKRGNASIRESLLRSVGCRPGESRVGDKSDTRLAWYSSGVLRRPPQSGGC